MLTSKSVARSSSLLSPAINNTLDKIGRVERAPTTFCTDCSPDERSSLETEIFTGAYYKMNS